MLLCVFPYPSFRFPNDPPWWMKSERKASCVVSRGYVVEYGSDITVLWDIERGIVEVRKTSRENLNNEWVDLKTGTLDCCLKWAE